MGHGESARLGHEMRCCLPGWLGITGLVPRSEQEAKSAAAITIDPVRLELAWRDMLMPTGDVCPSPHLTEFTRSMPERRNRICTTLLAGAKDKRCRFSDLADTSLTTGSNRIGGTYSI
jgi:hypothetical protein